VRVIVPYARLYPETKAALEADGWTPEYVRVGHDPTAYHTLVEGAWRQGETFAIIEQDIVPWPGSLTDLRDCPQPWCGFAYSLSTGYGAYLGCTRFDGAMLRERSGVFDAIANLPPDGTPRRYWGRLDTRLKQVLEDGGLRMHVHWPAVGHLNPDQQPPIVNRSCGHEVPDWVVRMGPDAERAWGCLSCTTLVAAGTI
jgi:hypothetical protein